MTTRMRVLKPENFITEYYSTNNMSSIRMTASNVMSRIVKSSGGQCQLHRLYKISFANGKTYIGQTKKLPHERAREHARKSSKCTMVAEQMRNQTPFGVQTLAVTGSHDIDTLEKLAIAIEGSLVSRGGLNIAIGGPGVKKENEDYKKFADQVRMVHARMVRGHHVSYDIMFIKNNTLLSEEDFKALRKLVPLVSKTVDFPKV
ncbi:GIY-YIG catalytic domain-containing endonuclease [Acanthocystis turfacea Chlorella virus MN0810.1]|nr:GIY-YIG catalytic domain-containing endonuclease [Acanthocystis turfacea Chlorella virus MN0810.1]